MEIGRKAVSRQEYVTFEGVEVIRETTDALLCQIEGKEIWMPKSQLSEESEVRGDGDKGDLVCSEWIANQKGLI